jgi:hypothetical protein
MSGLALADFQWHRRTRARKFAFNLVLPNFRYKDQAACGTSQGSTRALSSSNQGRPYIWRLMSFSRLICSSTGPLLHESFRDEIISNGISTHLQRLKDWADGGYFMDVPHPYVPHPRWNAGYWPPLTEKEVDRLKAGEQLSLDS